MSNISEFYSSVRPEWLLDTWRMCLVRATPEFEYVALSWGTTDVFTARRSNINQLQMPSSISHDCIWDKIAKTIQNAIHLVGILKERYLWVDQLCILQDDEEQKHLEVLKMAAIYAGAIVTIVAADGDDCNSGLKGIPGTTHPRVAKQRVYHLGKGKYISNLLPDQPRCRWAERGWTFQEEMLSSRRLIFRGGFLQWECSSSTWQEDIHTTSESCERNKNCRLVTTNVARSTGPDPISLLSIIGQYNGRDLTFPEDALLAITGVFTTLSRYYKGGFISGLPRVFFNTAVLWLNSASAACSRSIRRISKSSTSEKSFLPSWSWAGYQCSLDTSAWSSEKEPVLIYREELGWFCFKSHITSFIKWHYYDELERQWNPIQDEWKKWKHKYFCSNLHKPPVGWTRRSFPILNQAKQQLDNPLKCRTPWYYTHNQIQGIFSYPVPIPAADSTVSINTLARHISCSTRKSSFIIGRPIERRGIARSYSVLDNLGNWVGALSPDGRMTCHEGMQIEVVEVARGEIPNSYDHSSGWFLDYMDEWDADIRPKESESYKFMFVLMIDWIHDIAYRKGLGRIMEPAWEAEEPTAIDLILG
jgi:hypothetical protein